MKKIIFLFVFNELKNYLILEIQKRLKKLNFQLNFLQKIQKMPKQNLDLLDYFGPLAASIVFFSVIFVISVTCILWFCVSEKDDQTVFDKVFLILKGVLGGIFLGNFSEAPEMRLVLPMSF